MINFAFFPHPREPVIFHFYFLFLVKIHLNIFVSTVIIAIQVQLPNDDVLTSIGADFTWCVMIESVSLSFCGPIKLTGQILFKFATFHKFILINQRRL